MKKAVIQRVTDFIKNQLNEYIKVQAEVGEIVIVGSLVANNGNVVQNQDNIYITVVKIEEENITGKYPQFVKGTDGIERKLKPPISINLMLLFSATHSNYDAALSAITYVLGFFQSNHVFDAQNHPALNDVVKHQNEFVEKLIFEHYNLTMEQHNNLWASLGAKYLPSVLYKMRMLTFFDQQGEDTIPIEEINGTENN